MGPALLFATALTTVWTTDADLDGDGTKDHVVLKTISTQPTTLSGGSDKRITIPCEADPCGAELSIGASSVALPSVPGSYFGGLGIQVIDIDPSDKAKELLITHRAYGDGEDPPYVFEVVTLVGGKLQLTKLDTSSGYSSGQASVANKSLTVVYDDCPDKLTIVYTRKDDKIVESKRTKVRTHKPDTCAG